MEKRTSASERIGRNVRALRKGQDQTLAQLSAKLEGMSWPLSVGKLSKIERGDRGVDADDLEMLATALGVPVATLLGGDDPERLERVRVLFRDLEEGEGIIAMLESNAERTEATLARERAKLQQVRAAIEEERRADPGGFERISAVTSRRPRDLLDAMVEADLAGGVPT